METTVVEDQSGGASILVQRDGAAHSGKPKTGVSLESLRSRIGSARCTGSADAR